ncbi:MAG: hypothetical protein KBE04_10150 [Phycisphaerae bacterium]|nr:hypothetical protein [Phycisphaerae bacterium]
MDIVGPFSRHRTNSAVLYIVVLVGFGLWCLVDGYFKASFIDAHTGPDGRPDSTLLFNRYAPWFLFLGAAGLGAWLVSIRKRRVVATDTELVVRDTLRIPYDSIQQIDKTLFEKKGFFVVTYKAAEAGEKTVRLDDRNYENLRPILDRLIQAIT